MKIAIAITGASGTHLGIKLINAINHETQLHIVISKHAIYSAKLENKELIITHPNTILYDDADVGASLASGSFLIDKFAIVPCSMNTLAKCAAGIADTLITRAFSVSLKQKREIMIAPRESPFGPIDIENLAKLSRFGVTIAPPILGYYAGCDSVASMEDFVIGKWLDALKIEHNLFKKWEKI